MDLILFEFKKNVMMFKFELYNLILPQQNYHTIRLIMNVK